MNYNDDLVLNALEMAFQAKFLNAKTVYDKYSVIHERRQDHIAFHIIGYSPGIAQNAPWIWDISLVRSNVGGELVDYVSLL